MDFLLNDFGALNQGVKMEQFCFVLFCLFVCLFLIFKILCLLLLFSRVKKHMVFYGCFFVAKV